jgi:hypothetical protein
MTPKQNNGTPPPFSARAKNHYVPANSPTLLHYIHDYLAIADADRPEVTLI